MSTPLEERARAEIETAEVADAIETGNTPLASIKDSAAREIIAELAALDILAYEQRRATAAQSLGIRAAVLDKLVIEMRTKSQDAELIADLPVWPIRITDGAQLLDDIAHVISEYVVMAKEQTDAVVLWIAAAHLHSTFHIFPRLNVTAPERECGKSTLLDITTQLAPRALDVHSLTAATLFRLVETYSPTLLVDEVDTFLHDNRELRGLLNAGHKRGAKVPRCEGENNVVKLFHVFAPVVLAGIGELPGTIRNRSVRITLKRAKRGEILKNFDSRFVEREQRLCRMLARWATDNNKTLSSSDPLLPESAYNRVADNWRPLFCVAETAGGDWPNRARAAFAAIMGNDVDSDSVRAQLLSDIRDIFIARETERLLSAEIVAALVELEDRAWGEWKNGKAMTPVQLSSQLRPFGIRPKTLRTSTERAKGYELSQFDDAFDRYLTSSRDKVTTPENKAISENPIRDTDSDVTDQKSQKPLENGGCHAVTGEKPLWEGEA